MEDLFGFAYLGLMVVVGVVGPLCELAGWAKKRRATTKRPATISAAAIQLRPSPPNEPPYVASPPAATVRPRVRVDHLSPPQRRRLSAWIAQWCRLRVSNGDENRASVEAAIARIHGRGDRAHLHFVWVASPQAAAEAGVPWGEPARSWALPRLTPSDRFTGYIDWGNAILRHLSGEIRRELDRTSLGLEELQVIAEAVVGVNRFIPRFMDGTSAAFDDQIRFLAYCQEVLKIHFDDLASEVFALWMQTAGCFGWWWVEKDVCVVSERPVEMTRDDRGRLHRTSGPAVRFRDGFSVFVWHGTAVPEPWITAPETLHPLGALAWPNFQQRRAALEIIGWKRVLEALPARTIDADRDPAVGELVEADLPQIGPARFLKVRCGTGREFVLAVPRDLRTALEANAWTYALSSDQYKLEVRT